MPEGDTIFRAARTLNRALAGQEVLSFDSEYAHIARQQDESPVTGRTVEKVEARGKWLLMYFSGDLILATHMLMKGSWHVYRRGERWQMGRQHMRIHLQVKEYEAVAFRVPVAQFYNSQTLARDSAIPKLGPDILKDNFSSDEAAARLRAHPEGEVGDVLMNQKVVAGIGNIYKSETCFAAGINPFRLVNSLTDEEIQKLLFQARRLLKANVVEGGSGGGYEGLRGTTGSLDRGAKMWVYKREGRPCRRCGERILMRKQGLNARSTYWCPQCQKGSF